MKKIIYLLLTSCSFYAHGQSTLITPNTGGAGNFLFKSTGSNYGQFSTTSSSANLVFRVNEPVANNGSTGLITGAIYSDATRTLFAGYTGSGQLYGINKVEIGTNAVNNRMVMNNVGNVGIGVINPNAKLDVYQTGNSVIGWGSYLRDSKIATASNGAHALVNDNYDAIGVAGYGANASNTGYKRNIGILGTTAVGAWDNIAVLGYQKGAFNGSGYGYGVMGEIEQTGTGSAFGVYAAAYGAGTGTKYGIYAFASGSGTRYAGYFIGNVYVSGDFYYTGNFSATSDEKLKKNVKAIDNALDKVLALNPSGYEYKTNEYSSLNLASGNHYGFTAQGVQQVLPELVSEKVIENANPMNKEDKTTTSYLSVNYIEIIPFLTKAIQEQQVLIQQLQAEVKALKK